MEIVFEIQGYFRVAYPDYKWANDDIDRRDKDIDDLKKGDRHSRDS